MAVRALRTTGRAGALPPEWDYPAYYSYSMDLSLNQLRGSIPTTWANAASTFSPDTPKLRSLNLM